MEEQYVPQPVLSRADLPAKLREARVTSGISQLEIARVLGVSRRLVRYWESGERGISDARIVGWSRLTGKPLDWFFTAKDAA